MSYKLPDFLLGTLTPEQEEQVRKKEALRNRYYTMFPDTRLIPHIMEGIGSERYYKILEDCIKKGKSADELYPEVTGWDPDGEI